MTLTICTLDEFNAEIEAIGAGVPDADGHKRLSMMTVHHPAADEMNRLDPFSQAYRDAALGLYLDLRGRPGEGYEPARDEKSNGLVPADLFSGVSPWGFQDTAMVAEFLESWAQILRAMALPANSNAKILEYGPGSGQLLLMMLWPKEDRRLFRVRLKTRRPVVKVIDQLPKKHGSNYTNGSPGQLDP